MPPVINNMMHDVLIALWAAAIDLGVTVTAGQRERSYAWVEAAAILLIIALAVTFVWVVAQELVGAW